MFFFSAQQQKEINKELIDELKEQGHNVYGKAFIEKYNNEKGLDYVQQAQAEAEEMAEIKAKAQADGTFMLAPNGRPTNLTERQWLQVRTKAFKKWFGDWENDLANASKVVDENGEPLVVYHNTKNEFTKFSKLRAFLATLTGSNIFGNGFYFSNHQGNSLGNINMPVFLSVVNPSDGDMTSKNDGMIHSFGNGEVWYAAKKPNQIKSATDNNGEFSTENDDIQMAIGNRKPEYITDTLTDSEKDDIRSVLRKINKAGRTLVDTGEGLYLVDHSDREGIENRTENQEGFQCLVKIDTEGLRKGEIEELKNELTDEIIRDKTSISGVLKSHGYSERLQNSDSIDAKVRKSNADNAGLDTEASQGESLGGLSDSNSKGNSGRSRLIKTGADGTVFPRVIETPDVMQFTTPQGEVYGFVDKDGNIYLDEDVINPSHPLHEYTHLWDRAVAKRNYKFGKYPNLLHLGIENKQVYFALPSIFRKFVAK